ncbi:S8 family serine peptidase [Flavobacterium sp. NST-5]|uniref:S8 family serine peptidase n=1 Tax=Flavobacterium ichthyis TaxID=2698827 RepID=A0ABW9ZC65_9FLAO|nr:S8 family serine peptidase [Flavobacterium ichthyis]NBL64363.1 S8 family serine peptidase [Flavobacterium ichthyis]
MKKITFLIFILIGFQSFSQEDAWIYFADKPNAATFLSNPLTMLSQRALDRRTAQNISLDLTDVPISENYITQISNSPGIVIMAKSKWLNALHIRGSLSAIQNLQNFTFVDRVEYANKNLNAPARILSENKVQIQQKNLEVQVNYNYGTSGNQIQMLNGHLLHQQNFTGNGKIIAVMDAGFPNVNTASPFANLRNNGKIFGGYDFVNRSDNFYSGGSHGTLVLSTMGGYVENQLIGTAPNASYYLFTTEDVSSENPVEESYWVEAAEVADSLGVDIINTSLGYFNYDNPNYSHSYLDMTGNRTFISRGSNMAFAKGMICVTSAGNSGASTNPNIAAPADAFNVLAVGAVTPAQAYASFSSIGPSYDGRIKPDVMAQGQNSVVATTSGSVGLANGTSFSGPIMAGMVACLWEALPNFNNVEIMQIIKESAHLFLNPNEQFGYGIPDFATALLNGLEVKFNELSATKIYPNPTENNLFVQLAKENSRGKIVFYNQIGQKVLEFILNENQNQLNIQHLPAGLYLYQIESGGFFENGKIVKK